VLEDMQNEQSFNVAGESVGAGFRSLSRLGLLDKRIRVWVGG
jgi:hypothetical protein